MSNKTRARTAGRQSRWPEFWRRLKKSRSAMIGLAIISIMLLLTIFADWIASYDKAIIQDNENRLQPPSFTHPFGTDGYGRDVLARILHGGRVSLSVGILSTLLSLLFGGLLGSFAGYFGGRTDNIIMRIVDVLNAIPAILMALAILSAMGAGMLNLIMALSLSSIPSFVRMIRSAVFTVVDNEYITAAQSGGVGHLRIILSHILPNCMGTIIVQTTMNVSVMILSAASLSFIGMGVEPPRPEWGYMLSEAREYMRNASYLLIFPGFSICLATLALNLLGDGLRDALDPRLKS